MPGNPQRACSQFDIVDMCGFPKDYFYYYKAWWRKEPSLHVFPHWNWHGREGDEIPVWVYSNLEEVELLVNGASLGRQKVPHPGHVQWTRNMSRAQGAPGLEDSEDVLVAPVRRTLFAAGVVLAAIGGYLQKR